jgi:hypothetical protein
MRSRNKLNVLGSRANHRRPPRHTILAVRQLEDRRLLSGAPTAAMTQTATFPNIESYPNVVTQAVLYFNSTMGALTEVDIQISGSFSSSFSAENLGSSASRIDGTSSAQLTINIPTGGTPLSIPSITESFDAAPFDGTANDAGTSGKQFPAVTSRAAVQTSVLTSPADLAAFTGSFRVPITVSGHANGIATSTNNDASSSFSTQTSVTITVVYHYTPNLPSLGASSSDSGSQTSGQPTTSSGTGTSATTAAAGTSHTNIGLTGTGASKASATHTSSKGKKHVAIQIKKPTPKHVAAATHKVARPPHKASPR